MTPQRPKWAGPWRLQPCGKDERGKPVKQWFRPMRRPENRVFKTVLRVGPVVSQ